MRSDRIRGRLRVVAVAFLSNGILLACPQHAGANGWEHASIPFGALVEALADDAERMRTQAAESLGYRGESRAVPPLLAALERPEPSPRVRAAVYSALGRLGDARTVPVLGDCLTREAREEVRATCVSALAGVGGDESLSFVLAAYGSDDSIIVRRMAVDALGAFPQPASVRLLSELLRNEDAALRRRAVAALGHTGSRAATAPLLAHLETASQNERPVVVEALGRLRDASATDALLAELERAREPRLRAHIAMALAMIRAPSAYDALVGMLSDPVPAVRFHAVQGLRNLGRSEAAGELVALYRAESTRVADRSPRSLVMDAPVVLAALALQTDILRALTELDAPRGLPAFLDAARTVSVDRDSQVALRVAEAVQRQPPALVMGVSMVIAPLALGLYVSMFRIRPGLTRLGGVIATFMLLPVSVLAFKASSMTLSMTRHLTWPPQVTRSCKWSRTAWAVRSLTTGFGNATTTTESNIRQSRPCTQPAHRSTSSGLSTTLSRSARETGNDLPASARVDGRSTGRGWIRSLENFAAIQQPTISGSCIRAGIS